MRLGTFRARFATAIVLAFALAGPAAGTAAAAAGSPGGPIGRAADATHAGVGGPSVKAKAKAGTYKNKKKKVSFKVKKNKVRGFRVTAWTSCGGFPDLPTYAWYTYDFPTTKIKKNGTVKAKHNGDGYTTKLTMKLSGNKAKNGKFKYTGPNRCWATVTFTAKRKG